MAADIKSLAIYLGGLALTMLFCAIYSRVKLKSRAANIIWIILICLPLSIIAGLRDGVGTDYPNYVRIFNEVRPLSFIQCITHPYIDRGFAVLIRTLWLFSGDVKFIFFVMTFATLFIAFKTVSKYKDEMSLVMFSLFYYLIIYHNSLNYLRQCLAVSLVIWGLDLMLRKKYVKGLIVCIATMMIHSTAIIGVVFLIALVVMTSKQEKKKLDDGVVSGLRLTYYALVFASILLIPIALRLIVKIPFFSSYAKYVLTTVNLGIGRIVYFVILFVPLVLMWNSFRSNERLYSLFHIAMLYLPVSFAGYYFNWASRMNLYTSALFAILVPMVLRREKCKFTAFVFGTWYILFFAFLFVLDILIHNQGETFPYMI